MGKKEVAAGAFKQGCLALIDEVAARKYEIIITKRGRAVAKLVPMDEPSVLENALLAQWRGKAHQWVDDEELLRPSSELASWDVLSGGEK